MTKKIVLLGAGRSSSYLVDYLYNNKTKLNISLSVISDKKPKFIDDKYEDLLYKDLDIRNKNEIKTYIKNSFIVISLLPPIYHYQIAEICSESGINMITASYLDEKIKSLEKSFKESNSFLFMEMGLDPGIDHMSAMKIINRLKVDSEILEFESYTGGLVKDSGERNPWGYKFTWNPMNVILAGIDDARYIENSQIKSVLYKDIFKDYKVIKFPHKQYEGYPNRDSTKYKKLYKLDNIKTLRRGTLRNKGFCDTWDLLISLGLTDNRKIISNNNQLTYFDFFSYNMSEESLDQINLKLESDFNIMKNSVVYKNLEWSGFFSDKKIKLKKGFYSEFLLEILNDKWQLNSNDIDVIIMSHSFIFKRDNILKKMESFLEVEGDDSLNTAMAKTVGMPIALLVDYIINNNFKSPGIHLPFEKNIYEFILKKMDSLGIRFEEIETNI